MFECNADGNPPPKYQWIQKGVNSNEISANNGIVRSTEPKLHYHNITYDYQGEYVCVVSNTIGGKERTAESQTITFQVIGKYEYRTYGSIYTKFKLSFAR